MTLLIRVCMMAVFAVGLAFAAGVVVDVGDDTMKAQSRCDSTRIWHNGLQRCVSKGPYCGRGHRWNNREGRCVPNNYGVVTGASKHSGSGSCSDWDRDDDQGNVDLTSTDPCDFGAPGSSGFMEPGRDDGPGSFWEWLLWWGQ